jgi:vacuolar-type H+-ATPase subunit F/Vma7
MRLPMVLLLALRDFVMGFRLSGVDNVGELKSILDEEDLNQKC